MNSEKIVSSLPIGKIFKLIIDLIKLSKGGLTKEEGLILLEDLATIAADLAGKVSA